MNCLRNWLVTFPNRICWRRRSGEIWAWWCLLVGCITCCITPNHIFCSSENLDRTDKKELEKKGRSDSDLWTSATVDIPSNLTRRRRRRRLRWRLRWATWFSPAYRTLTFWWEKNEEEDAMNVSRKARWGRLLPTTTFWDRTLYLLISSRGVLEDVSERIGRSLHLEDIF